MPITPEELAALVPEQYAEFRPIVVDGIAFFLEHLSPERLMGILEAQAGLPDDADVSTRLVHFIHACPALHKLGQVIARRRELDLTLRRRLQELESMEPRTPIEQVRPIVLEELRHSASDHWVMPGDAPLAEASVAVVLPLIYQDPQSGEHHHGVAKVLKPGVAQLLDEDLSILAKLAYFIDEKRIRYGLPDVAYNEIFDEVRELLTHEIQFENEQANLRTAAGQHAGRADVQIPKVLPFSTPRMTAMERVFGVKVTSLVDQPVHRHKRLARIIAEALLADVVFTRRESSLFHADAHAGNLFAADDGRLAILDWSLTGRLSRRDREQLGQVVVGAFLRDTGRIGRAIGKLCGQTPDESMLRRRIEEGLAGMYFFPDPSWLMRLLDSLAIGGLRFRPDLMLFRKSYFTIEGVHADVCESCSLSRALMMTALHRLAGDWPLRMVTPFHCRGYTTSLSNADISMIVVGGLTELWRLAAGPSGRSGRCLGA